MANRAAAAFLVVSIFALIVLGVNYVLAYLGTDVLLDLYPWGNVSLNRMLRNTVVFAFAMIGWLITLVVLIMGILEMRSERLWRE
jgi:hypothetical protein